jgi:hypothetical protein
LTGLFQIGNVNYMSRLIFAALASAVLSSAAAAQQVPGRDLLEFPLGVLAEAKPLSMQMVAGLWNPATSALSSSERAALGFAGLTTPQEQGVQLEMVGAEYRVRPAWTASLSFANSSVSDILKTETDPQTIGGEIPYGTSLLSLGLATRRRTFDFGVDARYRWAALDTERAGVFSLDAGAILDSVAHTPLRVAASTFLFSPWRQKESATYSAAADIPVLHRDSTFVLRGGYSIAHTEGRGRDDYLFATTRFRAFDASAGVAQSTAFGNLSRRLRLGAGLRYAGYNVGIAREDGAAGIGGSYQFLLTRVFR